MAIILDQNPPVPIVFDTSILRGMSLSSLPAEFRQLQRLQEAGRVSLEIPEPVAREWLSQRSKKAADAANALSSAIANLKIHASLKDQKAILKLLESGIADVSSIADIRKASLKWHMDEIGSLKITTLPLHPDDAVAVWDSYFDGEPPFQTVKAREDLPDGLILAAVRRRYARDKQTVFVCHDGRLRDAAKTSRIGVAASLPDLLKLTIIANLHANPAFATWWTENAMKIAQALKHEQVEVAQRLSAMAAESLQSTTVRHHEIPDDNNEAWVEMADAVDSIAIDWNDATSLAEGMLSIPVRFSADLSLQFSVYRMDAFNVPEWVSVQLGDFEEDHYFDASGECTGDFTARLIMEFDEAIQQQIRLEVEDAELSLEDIELESLT